MNNTTIANILINMGLDMDYADYMEFYDDSIRDLASEINTMSDAARYVLERIAMSHEDYFDLFANK